VEVWKPWPAAAATHAHATGAAEVLTPAPAGNKSGHSTPKQRAEVWKPWPLLHRRNDDHCAALRPVEEGVMSPLRLGRHISITSSSSTQHATCSP